MGFIEFLSHAAMSSLSAGKSYRVDAADPLGAPLAQLAFAGLPSWCVLKNQDEEFTTPAIWALVCMVVSRVQDYTSIGAAPPLPSCFSLLQICWQPK